MPALVVYCHPSPRGYTAEVRDTVLTELSAAGVETTVIDLYAEGFQPVLTRDEWEGYASYPANIAPVAAHVAALKRADTLIFVYPTWWYGLPAMLKGWLDRVFLPEVAFSLQSGRNIAPTLTHVTRLGVFTTCGASWGLTQLIGAPGKRLLMRGVRVLCARGVRTAFLAHYGMDRSTPESRARHLAAVARSARRLIGGARAEGQTDAPPALG